MKTLYDILEVSKDATGQEIKSAYRKLSKERHPDKGGSEEDFIRINQAYVILIDECKRAEYDETGQYECDDVASSVVWIVSFFFDKAIDRHLKEPGVDVIEWVKMSIQEGQDDFMAEIKELDDQVLKYERLRSKVVYKGNGEDLFGSILGSLIFEARKAIRAKQVQVEASKVALEVVGDYAFSFGKDWLDHFEGVGWNIVEK